MVETFNSRYDDCQKNLVSLCRYYTENVGKRNEATTRLHLINTLLFDCLAWEKHDAICEEHQRKERNEYTDYTFFAPRRMMILEAKREGISFEVPSGMVSLTYTLKSLCKGDTDLKAAVDQVASYCQSRGVPIAVICNGHQLVAFVANRNDGVPPVDGKAIVFPTLHHMLQKFADFWQALSRAGIEDKNLQRRLMGSHHPELPPRLSASISDYPGTKGRNIFQSELKNITELVVEDIPESTDLERDFLENCYCQSGALSQHSLASKAILRARYSALFDSTSPGRPAVTSATNRDGVSQELYAESMSRRPILLLGNVGVGKSMFIRHLVNVVAEDIFKDAISIRIDLGTSATLAMDLKVFVVREIKQVLASKYGVKVEQANFVRGVYDLELKDFRQSIHGELADTNPERFKEKEVEYLESLLSDSAEHCRKSLEHLSKAREKQIVLFMDNADQRGEPTQDEAFLIAQEIAANWPVLVYTPLRPETFHRSVDEGALSGYHPKAFTVAPPRIDRVLEKRLQYSLNIADGVVPTAARVAQDKNVESLKLIIRSFLKSLHKEDYLVECIDNIAGGNVRMALNLVKGFFGSGHVDTQKIAEKSKNNLYVVPLHEFLRAAIYGDYVYYHPDRSPFANLFDISAKDGREHFLLPIFLSVLRQAGHANNGFIETDEVYSALQGLGFTPEQIDFAIVRAYRKRLMDTPASQRPDGKGTFPRMLRATTVGLYHLDRLMERFEYIDAVVVALPILDEDKRDGIVDVKTIAERFARARLFQSYLDAQWRAAAFPPMAFHWPAVSQELSASIDKAENANTKSRHRR